MAYEKRLTGGGGFSKFPIYSERDLSQHALLSPFSIDSEPALHGAGMAHKILSFSCSKDTPAKSMGSTLNHQLLVTKINE